MLNQREFWVLVKKWQERLDNLEEENTWVGEEIFRVIGSKVMLNICIDELIDTLCQER